MVFRLDVGRVVQGIDAQFRGTGQRHGEQTLAIAIEHAIYEIGAGIASHEKTPPPSLTYFSSAFDARLVDAIDAGECDYGELVQRTGRQGKYLGGSIRRASMPNTIWPGAAMAS